MRYKKLLDNASMVLTAVGGINWGLIGAFQFNLVEKVVPIMLVRPVYVLVGLGAVWLILKSFKR